MKIKLEKLISEQEEYLPIISHYWEINLHTNDGSSNKELNIRTISKNHNTSSYPSHTFYKPISTTINLDFFS
jgi:hypothetical protein